MFIIIILSYRIKHYYADHCVTIISCLAHWVTIRGCSGFGLFTDISLLSLNQRPLFSKG